MAVMRSFYENIDLVHTLFLFRFLEEDVLEELLKDVQPIKARKGQVAQ